MADERGLQNWCGCYKTKKETKPFGLVSFSNILLAFM